jgi:hypothetical protein
MEARQASQQPSYPFQLSLRIRHPSIDPAQISRELQIDPEHCFRAGDPREPSRNIAVTPVHAESYWLATLDPTALAAGKSAFDPAFRLEMAPHTLHAMTFGGVDSALALCAMNVLRPHAEFIKQLQSDGGEVRLIAALASRKARGFTITPEVSRVLSSLSICVDFELTHR